MSGETPLDQAIVTTQHVFRDWEVLESGMRVLQEDEAFRNVVIDGLDGVIGIFNSLSQDENYSRYQSLLLNTEHLRGIQPSLPSVKELQTQAPIERQFLRALATMRRRLREGDSIDTDGMNEEQVLEKDMQTDALLFQKITDDPKGAAIATGIHILEYLFESQGVQLPQRDIKKDWFTDTVLELLAYHHLTSSNQNDAMETLFTTLKTMHWYDGYEHFDPGLRQAIGVP